MSHAFTPFIKAIGAGKRAGRYLTEQEAFTAMSMVLNDEVLSEQKGAFLMLLRVREESVEELTGFVRACRTFLPAYSMEKGPLSNVDIDIACYAGKRRQLPWFILALGVLHHQGYRLFVHGTTEPHSARLYVKDAFRQLGLLGTLHAHSVTEARDKIGTQGIAYMDLQAIHCPLNNIIQLRELFGLRSCANTLARLLNPLNATFSVQGVHHHGIDAKHVAIAHKLQDKHVLCFRGEGGEPEVNPSKVSNFYFNDHDSGKPPFQVDMPERQAWQIKPKTLDVSLLTQYWQGEYGDEKTHRYALNAVIGTLVPILMMTKSLDITQATNTATRWWEARNKAEFLSIKLQSK